MGSGGARTGVQAGFAKAGFAAGILIGQPGLGFAIGNMLGGVVGNLLFPEDPVNTNESGPRLSDLSVQTSTYGNGIPLLYGTVRVAGNVIWSTKLIEHVNTTITEVEGGKGGSNPTTTLTTYTYTVSFAVSLCHNEIVGIKRIWADDKLWFDFTDPPAGTSFAYELYTGTEDQLPSPTIEADKGAGNVPAFRGQAYIVFKDLSLTKFGNRVPNFHFEVVGSGSLSISAQHVVTTTGNFGWWTRMALDTETGYIWVTNGNKNTVSIVDPELTLVRQFVNEIGHPYMISYQPPFQWLDTPNPFEIGQTPEVKEMPPRMWISCDVVGYINIGNSAAGCIDTRTHKVVLNNNIRGDVEGSIDHQLQPVLGVTAVDMRDIQVQNVNSELGQRVHFMGAGGSSSKLYSTIIGPRDIEFAVPVPGTVWNDQVASTPSLMNDAVASDPSMLYFYCVDYKGVVRAADYEMNPVLSRQDYSTTTFFNRLVWDKFERKLYALIAESGASNFHIIKYSEDLATKHWDISAPPYPDSEPVTLARSFVTLDIHPTTGALYALSQNLGDYWWIHEIDKTDGSLISDYKILNTQLRIWQEMKIYPNSMVAYVAWVGGGGNADAGVAKIPLIPGPTSDFPTLKDVVEDISTRTGLELTDLDAAPLAGDLVKGYAIANRMPARQAIEPLMAGYFFDAVESDYLAKFVKRGGASVKTITAEETGAHALTSEPTARREVIRAEENELPWQVDVNYMDVASLYKINVQYARRLIGQSKTVLAMGVAAVFTSTEARRIAEVQLYNVWMGRQAAKLRLTCQHAEIDPTDVVTFEDADLSTQTYRVARAEYGYPNRVELDLIEEDSAVYTAFGTGIDVEAPVQTVPSLAPTVTVFEDISIMGRAADNDVGFYFAGTPSYGNEWPGAGLYRSESGGAVYTAIADFPSAATIGTATTVIPYEGSIP